MATNPAFIPSYFQPILKRIEGVLGADVDVESCDEEWLNFTVEGYSDQEALRKLESNKTRVLVGADALNFRLLCPWDPSSDDGLWLHSLRHSDTPNDYLMGNWYY
jgi:hypothetical protein